MGNQGQEPQQQPRPPAHPGPQFSRRSELRDTGENEGTDLLIFAPLWLERLIKESGIPYSILHSTQFFEFAGAIVKAGMVGDTIRLSTALFQPIASDDVADALVQVIVDDPINGIVEVGGPEKIGMDRFAQKYLDAKQDTHALIGDPQARY
ncbi:MAG: hypothetical protein LOD90_10690, partial [Symbiobacteriaceae bacterium]